MIQDELHNVEASYRSGSVHSGDNGAAAKPDNVASHGNSRDYDGGDFHSLSSACLGWWEDVPIGSRDCDRTEKGI